MKIYPGMRKLYYQMGGKSHLAEAKANELRSSYSAIEINLQIGASPAFILYCDELIQKIAQIHAASDWANAISSKLPEAANAMFLKQSIVEEILQSNETEGVHSTRKEVQESMSSVQSGKKAKCFDGMIRKYVFLSNANLPSLSSNREIRNLYDGFIANEVLREDPADAPDGLYFRKSPVHVQNKHVNVIHEGVFPESKINDAMDQSLAFLNDDRYDPLIRIAAYHFLFAYIHPFYNGNGRMARFISSAKLMECGINRHAALRLSYVIKNHRNEYYALFKDAEDKRNYGDLTRFVIGFLDLVLESCKDAAAFLSDVDDQIRHYLSIIRELKISSAAMDVLFVLVQASICGISGLSISDLNQITGLSEYRLRKICADLIPYFTTVSKGNTTLYLANLEALDSLS